MDWIRILALSVTIADGAYSCKHINNGTAIESNKFIPKTCKGILIQKSVAAIPMFVITKNNRWRKVVIAANLTGSSIGLSFSIRNMRSK